MDIDARISTVAMGNVEGLQRIDALARIIWPICYARILSADQIEYMLERLYAVERLAMEQRAGVDFVWIAAGEKKEACGFASWGPGNEAGVCKLHKLYVLPAEWGKGLGGALLAHVTARAATAGYQAMRLNVNKYNDRAIAVYQRKGFAQVDAEVAAIGNGYIMDDYIMEKRFIMPQATKSGESGRQS